MLGSRVEPDLLETMNSVFARSTLRSTAWTCAGSVESSTCSSGKPGDLAEGLLPDLGAQAGAAHAQEQRVGEALRLHLGSRAPRRAPRSSSCCATMPSQPSQLASSCPVHSEASPAKSRRVPPCGVPASQAFVRPPPRVSGRQRRGCALIRALLASRQRRSTASRSFVNGSTNFLRPSSSSSSVTWRSEMPAALERGQGAVAPADVFLQARPEPAVVPEGREGLGGHGVDGLGADQLLDVEHVAVARGSWCRCWPTARAASGRPWPAGPPSGRRRRSSCSSGRRAWRWRPRPCPAGPGSAPCRRERRRRSSSGAWSRPGCRCGSRRSWPRWRWWRAAGRRRPLPRCPSMKVRATSS